MDLILAINWKPKSLQTMALGEKEKISN